MWVVDTSVFNYFNPSFAELENMLTAAVSYN